MSTVKSILRKELASYFNTPLAYIVLTVFITLSNFLFFRSFFLINQADMRPWFDLLPWIYLFFIPAVTMRLWAEERKSGTIELLLTFPVRDVEVVVGKLLAALVFVLIGLGLSFTVPITIALLGSPDLGALVGQYIGAVLLSASYLAIGAWVSSLTKNQIVAFILAVSVTFFLFLIGENFFIQGFPPPVAAVCKFLGLGAHFDSISRGVIDSRDILYYISVIFFFGYLNVKSIENRKGK
jgi:ABC-2 type transport system permease protein